MARSLEVLLRAPWMRHASRGSQKEGGGRGAGGGAWGGAEAAASAAAAPAEEASVAEEEEGPVSSMRAFFECPGTFESDAARASTSPPISTTMAAAALPPTISTPVLCSAYHSTHRP